MESHARGQDAPTLSHIHVGFGGAKQFDTIIEGGLFRAPARAAGEAAYTYMLKLLEITN